MSHLKSVHLKNVHLKYVLSKICPSKKRRGANCATITGYSEYETIGDTTSNLSAVVLVV